MYYNCPKTEQECEDEYTKHHAFSAHAWLEDDDGLIYDFWDKWWLVGRECKLEGLSKENIKKFGFEYKEFPKNIQTKMFVLMLDRLKWQEGLMRMGVTFINAT